MSDVHGDCIMCKEERTYGVFVCQNCWDKMEGFEDVGKSSHFHIAAPESYGKLIQVFTDAVTRATGKGETRHGLSEKQFMDQDGFKVRSMVGDGFTLGQAIKKISEAKRLGYGSERDVELLDAIVYLAMEVLAGRQ